MKAGTFTRLAIVSSLLVLTLSGCFSPPFNNFREDRRPLGRMAKSAAMGAGAGALAGGVIGSSPAGAVVGLAAGGMVGAYKNSKRELIKTLSGQDIQYIQYGDTMTLIVPTDRYFVFHSARLNDLCYPGLNNIIRLIKQYPSTPIYVAGFTDDVGSREHKNRLSQAQAETMLTFLWANDIKAQRLHPAGYGDKHDIGDNKLIHGSAYNRRIEIQWLNSAVASAQPVPYAVAVR